VARIAAANDPVDALVLVAGDLPLDAWREPASDEVIALNLHGPIHFARASLPARHDGAPAWRMVLVRSQGASAGPSPARCVTAKVSAWTVHAAKLAVPNRPWQSGHAGDHRYAWLRVWNGPCRCGTTTPAPFGSSKHRTAALRWVTAGPAPCVWPADSWAARLPWPSATRWRSRGNHAGAPRGVRILAARPRTIVEAKCELAAKWVCGRPP
jgi:NAD(P)-dependent dehydrogenase (short-subunit alcohol dehydrogenase family)